MIFERSLSTAIVCCYSNTIGSELLPRNKV